MQIRTDRGWVRTGLAVLVAGVLGGGVLAVAGGADKPPEGHVRRGGRRLPGGGPAPRRRSRPRGPGGGGQGRDGVRRRQRDRLGGGGQRECRAALRRPRAGSTSPPRSRAAPAPTRKTSPSSPPTSSSASRRHRARLRPGGQGAVRAAGRSPPAGACPAGSRSPCRPGPAGRRRLRRLEPHDVDGAAPEERQGDGHHDELKPGAGTPTREDPGHDVDDEGQGLDDHHDGQGQVDGDDGDVRPRRRPRRPSRARRRPRRSPRRPARPPASRGRAARPPRPGRRRRPPPRPPRPQPPRPPPRIWWPTRQTRPGRPLGSASMARDPLPRRCLSRRPRAGRHARSGGRPTEHHHRANRLGELTSPAVWPPRARCSPTSTPRAIPGSATTAATR